MALVSGKLFVDFAAPDAYRRTGKFDIWIMAGMMLLTVYAQIYSIFSRVGRTAFAVAAIATAAGCFFALKKRPERMMIFSDLKKIQLWKFCVALLIIAIIGLQTMKAPEFVDTYLYHAQAIRWIEEYGVVPGLGNLHNRFAYNSAFLALQALFSFSWIYSPSLHTVNGFAACFILVYAVVSNRLFTSAELRLSDFLKMVVVVYIYVNRAVISSPGTDILAMVTVIYIFIKWNECIESGEENRQAFCVVSLLGVWAVTLKLSAAACLLFALPLSITLFKDRKWEIILTSLGCGFAVIAPWLIRNVIISGYLLYPYPQIDLFDFDWKMPVDLVEYDSQEIIVWARELKDVGRFGESVVSWFPGWFHNQMFRYRLFIVMGFAATFFLLMLLMIRLVGRMSRRSCLKNILSERGLVTSAVISIISEVFWLFSAPLLRYGMVYLLMPAAVGAHIVNRMIGGDKFRKCMLLCGTFAACVGLLHQDDSFRLIMPHDYWKMETGSDDRYGFEIYFPTENSLTGYTDFPAVTDKNALDKFELRGNEIKDGFRARAGK